MDQKCKTVEGVGIMKLSHGTWHVVDSVLVMARNDLRHTGTSMSFLGLFPIEACGWFNV